MYSTNFLPQECPYYYLYGQGCCVINCMNQILIKFTCAVPIPSQELCISNLCFIRTQTIRFSEQCPVANKKNKAMRNCQK